MIPGDPCAGPNHGNPDALPPGNRVWVRGYIVSITQSIEGQPDSHMVFCSADCMCDWHGAHEAYAKDREHLPEFSIPGRFALVWVTPPSSLLRVYEDWEGLTAQIGEYQSRILKQTEAAEGGWLRPYNA